MITREPAVAGQFYPGTRAELENALFRLIDKKAKQENAICAVVPHAGYMYSGPVAGRVFSRLAPKRVFVIIGPNHTGIGASFSVFPKGSWKTPLGCVETDAEFADYLVDNSDLFRADEAAHTHEHSIEVQLPFLQYIARGFKILPICVMSGNMDRLKEAGQELAAAIKTLKKDTVIIASSDMTHYEPHEEAKAKDMHAISAILDMDEDRLLESVVERGISMCGAAPVIIALNAAKSIGAKKAELIDYKTSGDASGDYSSVVGYGGVIII